jgi:hypothetical protein
MAFISARWDCFPWLVSCSDMFNVLVSNVFAGRRAQSVVCVYVSVCVVCAAGDHFSSAGRKKCSGSAADGELRVPRIKKRTPWRGMGNRISVSLGHLKDLPDFLVMFPGNLKEAV